MRYSKINYVIVGSFVLTMLVGFVIVLAVLTGRTGPTDTYFTRYDDVTGLKFGTPVLFDGYPVGQIERITPVHDGDALYFRVDLGIAAGWPVPADSVAQVTASGLLSAVTVNIGRGRSAALLSPGDEIAGRGAANIFAALSNVAYTFDEMALNDIRPLLDTVNGFVGALNRLVEDDGAGIAGDLRSISGRLSEGAPQIVADLQATTAAMRAGAERIETAVSDTNVRRVDSIFANVDATAANFAALSGDLNQTRDELNRLVGNLNAIIDDNKLDIDQSIIDMRYALNSVSQHIGAVAYNLEGTSRNMLEFSRQLRQNPGVIFSGGQAGGEWAE